MAVSARFREKPFWNMPPEEVSLYLESDIEQGLHEEEAQKRLLEFGRNKIEIKEGFGSFKIFFRQFTSPLILILIAATAVTVLISHYRDAVFIFIAVIVNAVLGFYQENKAEKSLSELKDYLKQRSRVIRAGKEREIDTEELVVGDIIRLSQGDRAPADTRLIFVNDFQVDESVLTGESLPVIKDSKINTAEAGIGDQTSMVFAGTLITQGVASAIVCRTDNNTEFGKIAALLSSKEQETPLQKSISNFSIKSSVVLGILTVIVFVIGISYGYGVVEMFLTSVAIAVSAIPEGLPVALTVILSVGVQRMARRKGVVRKLIAAETLGGTTVILTDKTGTLTMARMDLTEIIPLGKLSEKEILLRGLTNSNVLIENPNDQISSWRMNGKIMEIALVRGSALRGIDIKDKGGKDVIQSIPFNAIEKFSVSLVKEGQDHFLFYFGAPDVFLRHSTMTSEEKVAISTKIDKLASEGKRVLGVASQKIDTGKDFSLSKNFKIKDVILDGLLTFHDPVRPQVKDAIYQVKAAGIKTVILTGDHIGTAKAIAREVGMNVTENSVLDASELANISDEELKNRLPYLEVISRVTPFDKLRIAKLFQARGEVVAMTGDGVNDAPSIKQADVGIAMGSGTEVSRSVADLVLLNDNFETIVAAIEEGRHIMENIRKILVYLFSNVTDGLILIGGSLLLGLALPLNALQILWVNFFSDSFPAVAFAFERNSDVLSQKPRKSGQGLFDPLMRFLVLTIGFSTSILLFVLYFALLKAGFEERLVRTFIFASFGTYTLFVALSVRSLDKSIFSYSLFSNKYMVGGISIGLVLMALAIYVPILQSLFDTVALPFSWAMGVVTLGVVNILCIEFGKWIFRQNKTP